MKSVRNTTWLWLTGLMALNLVLPVCAEAATVSPEFMLTNPIYGPDEWDQDMGRIACNDSLCLFVWRDEWLPMRYARVSADATVLDPVGLPLPADDRPYEIGLAWGGGVFLVVWMEETGGAFAARINADGELLDTTPLVLDTPEAVSTPRGIAVSFDGANFFVVWAGWGTPTPEFVKSARISPAGAILDPGGVLLSDDGPNYYPAVSAGCGTDNCLAAWGVWWEAINAVRVGDDGVSLDEQPIAISTLSGLESKPAVAFDGTNYLVVLFDDSSPTDDTSYDIYGVRLSPGGEVLDPDRIAISQRYELETDPTVAYNGGNFLVVWAADANGYDPAVRGARVSPAGEVLDPISAVIAGDNDVSSPQFPAIGAVGDQYLVGWVDTRGPGDPYCNTDIYASRVTTDAVVLDGAGFDVSLAANEQILPQAAFDGTNHWVVWMEHFQRATEKDILGARIAPDGTMLDPNGIVINNAAYHQTMPMLACLPGGCLVVWNNHDDEGYIDRLRAARLNSAGGVLDPSAINLTDIGTDPAVATDGENYLVLWIVDFAAFDVQGVRVSAAGELLPPNPIFVALLAPNGYTKWNLRIAYGAGVYFVVWADRRRYQTRGYDVYGTRITPDGDVLDPLGIPIAAGDYSDFVDAIAFDGENFFVVWENNDTPDYQFDIRGARVTPGGEVLDGDGGIPICTAAEDQWYPSIVFDGENYFVAWEDYRNSSAARYTSELYGTFIRPDGAVLTPDGFPISAAPAYGYRPALSASEPGRMLTVYEGDFPLPPWGNVRLAARVIETDDDSADDDADDDSDDDIDDDIDDDATDDDVDDDIDDDDVDDDADDDGDDDVDDDIDDDIDDDDDDNDNGACGW